MKPIRLEDEENHLRLDVVDFHADQALWADPNNESENPQSI